MKIKTMRLKDFCGFRDLYMEFGDFTCLIGVNGIGKTTVLEAVSLLCSSLDFKDEDESQSKDDEGPFDGWVPRISGQQRLEAYLERNKRLGERSFLAEALFEYDGNSYEVVLNEKGFVKNDIIDLPCWRHGLCFFARFDSEMTRFQLRKSLWPRFAKYYEGITGIPVTPEFFTETDLEDIPGIEADMAINFVMDKGKRGKIPCKYGSAGEKKIARTLSHVVDLDRLPYIALVDNLEMHVHHSRHIRMFEEVKDLFSGVQVITTTHSTEIINDYEPRTDIRDLDEILEIQDGREPQG